MAVGKAKQEMQAGGGPFGDIVVWNGEVIASGVPPAVFPSGVCRGAAATLPTYEFVRREAPSVIYFSMDSNRPCLRGRFSVMAEGQHCDRPAMAGLSFPLCFEFGGEARRGVLCFRVRSQRRDPEMDEQRPVLVDLGEVRFPLVRSEVFIEQGEEFFHQRIALVFFCMLEHVPACDDAAAGIFFTFKGGLKGFCLFEFGLKGVDFLA